jgi:hypothetical protein
MHPSQSTPAVRIRAEFFGHTLNVKRHLARRVKFGKKSNA